MYLDEYGESDFLNICSDGAWITIGYCSDDMGSYSIYNPDFADSDEMTDLDVGGQSPVDKRNAIQDFEPAKILCLYRKALSRYILDGMVKLKSEYKKF